MRRFVLRFECWGSESGRGKHEPVTPGAGSTRRRDQVNAHRGRYVNLCTLITRPVSGPADEEIKAYSMDLDTGGLELRTTSKAHGPIGWLHLHRASGIVYGAQVLSTELSSYHLDTDTGALTHINSVDTGLATPALAVTTKPRSSASTVNEQGNTVTVLDHGCWMGMCSIQFTENPTSKSPGA